MSIIVAATTFRRFLNQPSKVAMTCATFLVAYLVFNGTVFRLWSLDRDFNRLQADIEQINSDTLKLEGQLREAKDPAYIEKQARDRLDLVSENDIVFVFANE